MQKTGTVGTKRSVPLAPSKEEASKRGRETSVTEMQNCARVRGDERRLNLLSEDPEFTELVACVVCLLWVYRF